MAETLIQDFPLTWSDGRMHLGDESCWCDPTRHGEVLHHHRPPSTVRRVLRRLLRG